MEHWNLQLFLLLNAASPPGRLALDVAWMLAQGAIWLVPAGLVLAWLRGARGAREAVLIAALAGALALGANGLIGLAWYHPRPAEAGIGHAWLAHMRDSSFPSDHLALMWAVAFVLLLWPRARRIGAAFAALGLPVAWARIYLGVHFPLDMAGSVLVAAASAAAACAAAPAVVAAAMPPLVRVHRTLFSGFINKGWIHE
ncbi:MAG TPA: undecaprenyl-diphosphatase [Burkholderiales bacterium]|nr:undecaprenyl-diphosphatase [Burkholderiales bacterium]